MPLPTAPDAGTWRPVEMPFESIKARARRIFVAAVSTQANLSVVPGADHSASYRALLPFIRTIAAERSSLRAFILSLPLPPREDGLGQQARHHAEQNRYHWSQLLLQVRVVGERRIDAWDVRCVGHLVEMFPQSVPKSWRGAALSCRVEEPSGQWLVGPGRAAPSFPRRAGRFRP